MIFRKRARLAALAALILAAPVALALDRVRNESGANQLENELGTTGAGVVIAIIDRGIDWSHPDFINDDGTTRIKWLLDMSNQSNWCQVGNPAPVEYSEADINAALTGGPTVNSRDAVGHGTVSAGIAASNGRAFANAKYRGIAPEADLVIVKLTSEGAPAHDGEPAETGFIACFDEALDWLETKMNAMGQPVVALANIGTQFGPMDGTSALSQKIDAVFGEDNPGRIWISPVGDEGDFDNHAGGNFDNTQDTITNYNLLTSGTYIETMWYDGAQPAEISVELPNGTIVGPVAPGGSINQSGVFILHYNPGTEFYPWASTSGDYAVWIRIIAGPGSGSIRIRGQNAGVGRFDMYGSFTRNFVFTSNLVPGRMSDIATTRSGIVVGAYVNKNSYTDINSVFRNVSGQGSQDEKWHGSSGGPTRDNRSPGVDILSPGHNLIGSYGPTSYWGSLPHLLINDGGGYYGIQGAASGAAPIVLGAVALLLEIDPTLTAREARDILRSTAKSDSFTGTTPNTDWGYGKLDIYAAGMIVLAQSQLSAIVAMQDISGNGMPEVGVSMPGSTHVHIRDGSTDALITDINFGDDDALQMAVVPDLNASGNPEIAMLNEQASGQVRVQIRDSLTGAITKNLYYGLAYEPVAMDVMDDYSGNGLPEIAVLGSEAGTDAVRVQVQDTSTGFLDNVFLGTQSIASDLIAVTDTSGNGIPEIGILGVLKSSNQVRSQLWDADTAAFQANVWFGNKYQPQSMITMPDINMNGSDEIVAMGVDPATDNIRLQVRDSDSTATLFNIWLGAVNEAVDVALINDINSDGVADLAVLLKTPGGTGRVRVQSGANGAFIRNLFYSVVENPVGLAVMPDYNGGGFDELAVLGESAGVRHVQILDTSTGTQVNRIDFP